ncbi:polysaccharide pyruvyl transferase [Erythrobacter sp. SD-21]|nr:polysaccharide pyruvyl transferase [Erythrobacter sp. SD-21]
MGALTLGNIAIIRQVAEECGIPIKFVVLSMRESATKSIAPGMEQYEIDTRALLLPSGFARRVRSLDCIIDIGAGDSFADIYGFKRFFFLWLTKMISVSMGKPLILAPQTIGPFTRQPYKKMAAAVFRRSAAIVARDEKSLSQARALAPESNVSRAVDVAFKLPFEDRSDRTSASGLKRIGINASGLLCQQAQSGENRFALSFNYLELQRELIRRFTSRDDCKVHLITHANSIGDAGDDDGVWADRLAREFPQTVRVPDFPGPSEAKSYISGMDFVVAGRMHACIAAFSSCTPVVPVSYSRKFSGLFDLLQYPYYTPMTSATAPQLADHVMQHFHSDREAMKRAESAALLKVDDMLAPYRAVLQRTLTIQRTAK